VIEVAIGHTDRQTDGYNTQWQYQRQRHNTYSVYT